MSIRDITLGQTIIHIRTGIAYHVLAAETGAWVCGEAYGPTEGRRTKIFLHQLPEFRVMRPNS